MSGRGVYRIGMGGMSANFTDPGVRVEFFDLRWFPRRLTDEELCRIHGNGVLEIQRRGVPRWK